MKPDRKFLLAHLAHFVALGGGAGLATKAPGTFGTLAAIPLYLALYPFGGPYAVLAAAVALFGLGVWASEKTGLALGASDHGSIVIDEIAAFLLVLACTPPSLIWGVVAFGLFRLFDIVKPWPISIADAKVKGGFGVMLDDLLAALATLGCTVLLETLLARSGA
jgi:phosphatidylglycerophosphatase A